jgi:hypothetical protein
VLSSHSSRNMGECVCFNRLKFGCAASMPIIALEPSKIPLLVGLLSQLKPQSLLLDKGGLKPKSDR